MEKEIKFKSKYQKNINRKTKPNTQAGKENNKEKIITDWFYMTPGEVTAKMIYELIKLKGFAEAELWEEMNVLQLELPDKKTVDFDPANIQFKTPSDAAFVRNRNIKTIFAVTVEEGAFEPFQPVLKIMLAEWEGFLCADSDDFKPIYGIKDI